MSYSLNEVEAIVKRATFASGYSWGIAEEAAKATRWLCMFGFDGCEIVGSTLKLQFAKALHRHSPGCNDPEWSGEGKLCPLVTGVSLSDFSSLLLENPIVIRKIAIPKMILPFVGQASTALNKALTIQLANKPKLKCIVSAEDIEFSGEFPTNEADLIVRIEGEIEQPIRKVFRVKTGFDSWTILNELADLTYAPATEESRKLGAGSELEDND